MQERDTKARGGNQPKGFLAVVQQAIVFPPELKVTALHFPETVHSQAMMI
jgi:hypothetical protein